MLGRLMITHVDETVVEGDGRNGDLIRFERQFHKPSNAVFDAIDAKELPLEWLWFFAWCVERREVENCPEFDDWFDTVEIVEILPATPVPPTSPDGSPTP